MTCNECGFFYTDKDEEKCHITKETITATSCDGCKTYIVRQYDGSEPFSPQEHEWLLQNSIKGRKMTNMQGLRF